MPAMKARASATVAASPALAMKRELTTRISRRALAAGTSRTGWDSATDATFGSLGGRAAFAKCREGVLPLRRSSPPHRSAARDPLYPEPRQYRLIEATG